MTTTMLTTTKYFSTAEAEAEAIIDQQKQEHGDYIKSHSITRKIKKDVEYFIIQVTVEYYKDKDLVSTVS
ncbi:hypothetical protein [Bacillus sp. Bos-x628]|uniref:hypothetical protein n=1 Tax=Bacillus maqinnsis TaxID=3229854 RepID=UPI00338DB0BF